MGKTKVGRDRHQKSGCSKTGATLCHCVAHPQAIAILSEMPCITAQCVSINAHRSTNGAFLPPSGASTGAHQLLRVAG